MEIAVLRLIMPSTILFWLPSNLHKYQLELRVRFNKYIVVTPLNILTANHRFKYKMDYRL
jgi:hypothetical protein